MVEHPKLAPDIYRLAMSWLALEPGQCLAIEDSPTGIRAAGTFTESSEMEIFRPE